jgi:hypothetical protein
MAHAQLHPVAKHTGRGNKISGKPENLSTGHWQNLVSQARAVHAYSPELGKRVREGLPLSEAFEQAKREREAAQSEAGRGKRGATVAPRFDDVPTLTQLGLPSDAGKKRSTPNASPWRR